MELRNTNLTQGLVDNGLAKWNVLHPYSFVNGTEVVIEGRTIPLGYTLTRNDRIITTTTDAGDFPGLVSGTFTLLGAASDCPDSIALSHGDLNKDDSSRLFFQYAMNMAIDQTRHEWCRLLNLVDQTYGENGVSFLFNNWVDDSKTATTACSR